MKYQPPTKRLAWVDSMRGFAIVLMVIFHFCYDLRYFGYAHWNIPNGDGWWQFRYVILTLFIATAGMSLSLAHGKKIRRPALIKRLWQLVGSAVAITIMSLFLFPATWIYFGILHFIAVATLIGIVVVKRPIVALILGALLLIGFWLGELKPYWPFNWLSQWLPDMTEDFVPVIPWLGVYFVGMGIAGVLPLHRLKLPSISPVRFLTKLGRNSLIIYLIHQPLLFAGFLTVQFFT